jgi:hypothetical protein
LDALCKYDPESPKIADELVERLIPFLKSSNAAVVIGAFRCIFLFMEFSEIPRQGIFPRIIPPFIALVNSTEPELQFVVLRTISLFVQKFPRSLAKEIGFFFCKYNDRSYIKLEKLNIIMNSVQPANAPVILDELIEYSSSIDVHFVRKSIRAIGQIALKIPHVAHRSVDVLVRLIGGKAEYSAEESIVILADILRKYPGQFEGVISTIFTSVDKLKDAHARAALVWMLGEYSALIEGVDVILDPFLDSFHDEDPEVQLQLVSAVTKVFLENPGAVKDQLQFVLNEATKDSVLPDVRNRAVIYWRLLTLDPEVAKRIMVFSKSEIEYADLQYPEELLNELLRNMGSVSGVLHVLPSCFGAQKGGEELDEGDLNEWRELGVRGGIVSLFSRWSCSTLFLKIVNLCEDRLFGFALAVNSNGSGFTTIGDRIVFPDFVDRGEEGECRVEYKFVAHQVKGSVSASALEFALKTSAGVVYFTDFIDLRDIIKVWRAKRAEFLDVWRNERREVRFQVNGVVGKNEVLEERKVHVVADRDSEICVSFECPGGRRYLGDIEFRGNQVTVNVKGDEAMFPLIQENAKYLFCVD